MRVMRHTGSKDILMDPDEMDYVLNCFEVGSRFWLAYALFGRCGLRSNEAVRINSTNIVFDHEPLLLELESSGGRGDLRRVPVPDDVAACINGRDKVTGVDGPTLDVATRTIRSWPDRIVDEIIEEKDREEWRHLSPKSFRHSWAINLLDDGVPPKTVMRWGGWRDPVSFHNIYIFDDTESDHTKVYESDVFKSKTPLYIEEDEKQD